MNRDGCRCCLCGSHDGLAVHHILYRRLYPPLQLEPDNLMTVCKRCHWSIHKGVGNLMLMDWLMTNRPAQWEWVRQHIPDNQSK